MLQYSHMMDLDVNAVSLSNLFLDGSCDWLVIRELFSLSFAHKLIVVALLLMSIGFENLVFSWGLKPFLYFSFSLDVLIMSCL